MSVILDALKKLDREKSSRRNEPASIAAEILKPDLPSSRKKISLTIALGTFTIMATAAITYAVMAKFGFLSKSSSPVPANLSAPVQQASSASPETGILLKPSSPTASGVPPSGPSGVVPAPSPPLPAIPPVPRQQAGPAPTSREPVRDARDKISQVPPEVEDDAEDEERALSLRREKAGRRVMPGKADVPGADAKKTTEPTPSGSGITPTSLKLSAIVWYEEPAKRFAVINGVISYEGSVIEGAKVVEIYPDRVRFVQNDRQFEVPMFK
jgi:general secretion pathway protein B